MRKEYQHYDEWLYDARKLTNSPIYASMGTIAHFPTLEQTKVSVDRSTPGMRHVFGEWIADCPNTMEGEGWIDPEAVAERQKR